MRVSCLGLGMMGRGIAANAAAAFDTVVWNRTAPAPDAVPGARVAGSVAEAAAHGEVVVTMLADDAAVRAVTFGEGGLLAHMAHGAVHVGMSTISVALTRELVAAHAERGQCYVAAPVFGRPEAAAAARLVLVTGGDMAAVARCAPLFERVGAATLPQADAPAAALTKLIGNFCIAATIEMLAEAFALGEKQGIAPEQLLPLFSTPLFASPLVQNYARLVQQQAFEPAGFAMPLGLKDVRLVLEAAGEVQAPLPLASLVRDRLLEALAAGGERRDWSGFAAMARRAAGLDGGSGHGR